MQLKNKGLNQEDITNNMINTNMGWEEEAITLNCTHVP